jgi:DNA-binding XRE family transcriptional regulator
MIEITPTQSKRVHDFLVDLKKLEAKHNIELEYKSMRLVNNGRKHAPQPKPEPSIDLKTRIPLDPKKFNAQRKRQGFTYRQVAAQVGVSSGAVAQWASGKTNPTKKHLLKIGKLFGIGYKAFTK